MFLNSLLLYGTALAAVPIVIHLLNKRRFKPMRWAAMEFLLKALKQNTRRLQLRDIILMLIRAAAVALLALTLARPMVAVKAGILGGRRTAGMILLDNSLSMAHNDGRETRFDRAKHLVKKILVSLDEEDNALGGLLTFNDEPNRPLGDPPQNLDYLLKEADRAVTNPTSAALYRTDAGTNLEGALKETLKLFESSPEFRAANKELYLVTDMQARPWLQPHNAASFKQLLGKLSGEATVYLVNAGDTGTENAALETLKVSDELAAAGVELEFTATVRNFGNEPLLGTTVDLFVDPDKAEDQRPTDRVTVDVPPGGRAGARFRHTFNTGGDHLVEVRTADDRLPTDNRRRLVVHVQEDARLLLVDGRERRFNDPLSTATPYLRRALAPRDPAHPDAPRAVRAEVVPARRLAEENLRDYETVVLADVGGLSESDARALAKRVREGMGLLIFLGENTDPDEYEQLFGKEGADLLPAHLGKPWGEKPRPDAAKLPPAHGFALDRLEHIVMSDFRSPLAKRHLGLIKVWKAYDLTPIKPPPAPAVEEKNKGTTGAAGDKNGKDETPEKKAKDEKAAPESEKDAGVKTTAKKKNADGVDVAAWFDNGKPAIVERRAGAGRVLLFAVPPTTDWSNLPLMPGGVILLIRAANYVSAGARTPVNVAVNEPLHGFFGAAELNVPLLLRGPGSIGRRTLTASLEPDGRASFSFPQTNVAGFYTVSLETTPKRRFRFAVNPGAPEESDLTTVSPAELHKALPNFKFTYIAQSEDVGKKSADERKGVELWPWLIAGVFLLLLTESVLAHLWVPRE